MPSDDTRPDPNPADEPNPLTPHHPPEILSQRMHDALLNARPEDLIPPDPQAEIIKGHAHAPGGWLHGPAHLELFAAADKRLTEVARLSGLVLQQVDRVHATLVKGTQLVVLQAAPANDYSAIPVTRYDGFSSAWINLITLLGPRKLTVTSGYRERFEIVYVPEGSLLWPGLTFDRSLPKERRQEPQRRRKKNGASA